MQQESTHSDTAEGISVCITSSSPDTATLEVSVNPLSASTPASTKPESNGTQCSEHDALPNNLLPVRLPASETGSETSYRFGDEVLEYPALHPDMEWEEPPASTTRRMLLLVVGTVVLWPFSLLPLVCMYGWRGAWHVLGNVGIGPQWMCLRGVSWTSRSTTIQLFLQHHVSTTAYIVALLAWACSDRVAPDNEIANVSRAAVVFQLLSVAAAIISRRVSVAVVLFLRLRCDDSPAALMSSLTRCVHPPARVLTYAVQSPTDVGYMTHVWLPNMTTALRAQQLRSMPAAVVNRQAYEALRALYDLCKYRMLPSPETLSRCQHGRIQLQCVGPSRVEFVPVASITAPLSGTVRLHEGAAPSHSMADRYALCDWCVVGFSRCATYWSGRKYIWSFLGLTSVSILLSVALPFVQRVTVISIPALGAAGTDACTFVSLGIAELSLMSAVAVSAQCTAFIGYLTNVGTLQWIAAATDSTTSHVDDCLASSVGPRASQRSHQSSRLHDVYVRLRHALQGGSPLDSTAAVEALWHTLRVLLCHMSTSGVGHTVITLGFVVPVSAVMIAVALAVALNVLGTDGSRPFAGITTTAVRAAVIIPTCTALIAFTVHCLLLIVGFHVAGRIVSLLKQIDDNVVHCEGRVALALEAADRQGMGPDALRLLEALRSLHTYLQQRIRDYAGIRFLGVFRPGALSIGGVLAVMASATVLAVRLMAVVGVRPASGLLR